MTLRVPRFLAFAAVACVAACVSLSLEFLPDAAARAVHPAHGHVLHYAANGNFGPHGEFLPGRLGFNVADVSNVDQVNRLPPGVKGLVWTNQCNGVDDKFLRAVEPFVGNPKLFGFFLMDDPDPRSALIGGKLVPRCRAANLRAESDWIHAHIPHARTLIVLMNMSSAKTPSFRGSYNPANSHVDLFGLAAYPCKTDVRGCDYAVISRYVTAAEAWGVPRSRIVPIFQTFGGGEWRTDAGGQYILPTVSQLRRILIRWRAVVAAPELDMVYSWGTQRADIGLDGAPDLQDVFWRHIKYNSVPRQSWRPVDLSAQ
jgi:hypothetical protein